MSKINQPLCLPTRFLHTPLLVSVAEAELMGRVLRGDIGAEQLMGLFDDDRRRRYEVHQGLAVLPVMGGLTYRGYGWYWRSTYSQVRANLRAALADAEVEAVVLDIDSCGGEVAGCFDLVDEIYAAREEKPIYAVIDEDCFSAAYAIASAAQKIYIPRTGNAGSIGVICIHLDQSGWDKDMGLAWTPIYAGARKNDFSAHAPLSDEAAAVLQARVDETYDLFCTTVARNRGLEAAVVKKTQAAIYKGAGAVSAGLADAVASWDQALADILSATSSKGAIVMQPQDVRTGLAAMIGDPETREAAHQLIQSLGFVPTQSQEETTQAIEAAREEGRAAGESAAIKRAVAVIDACALAGLDQMSAALVKEGVSLEDAQTRVTEAKAAQSNGQQVNSATTATGAGEQSPLVAEARKRAGVK